jgi:hypothetical protein
MKTFLKTLLLALMLNACANKSKSDSDLPPKEVNLSELKSILPKEIFSKKFVYFKDKAGKEVKINLTYTEMKDQMRHNSGFEYTRERSTIEYKNEEKRISILFDLSSQLSTDNLPVPTSAIFVGNNVNDHADFLESEVIVNYDSNLKKLVSVPTFSKEIEEDIVLKKTFKKVFRSTYTADPYKNELGFNATYGVISLNDFDKNLYVFDRFE